MSARIPVFVYGSLKQGFRHADVVRRAVRSGPAAAEPFILVRYGQYPAMAPAEAGSVRGELLWVGPSLLEALDEFEECPALYQRQQIRLTSGRLAFSYLVTAEVARGYPRIESGVWLESEQAR